MARRQTRQCAGKPLTEKQLDASAASSTSGRYSRRGLFLAAGTIGVAGMVAGFSPLVAWSGTDMLASGQYGPEPE